MIQNIQTKLTKQTEYDLICGCDTKIEREISTGQSHVSATNRNNGMYHGITVYTKDEKEGLAMVIRDVSMVNFEGGGMQ